MGDRAHAVLNYGDNRKIYVYTHWSGSDLPVIVGAALERGESRWTDDAYLARIITSQVFADAGIMDTTGAGLAPFPQEDTSRDVEIILPHQQVLWQGRTYTFPEFVEAVNA